MPIRDIIANGGGYINSSGGIAGGQACNGNSLTASSFSVYPQFQYLGGANAGYRQGFLSFDLSELSSQVTISDVSLFLYCSSATNSPSVEVYVDDAWPPTLLPADFLTGAQIAASTLVATATINAGAGWYQFTSEAAFLTRVQSLGTLGLVLDTSLHKSCSYTTSTLGADFVKATAYLRITHSNPPSQLWDIF